MKTRFLSGIVSALVIAVIFAIVVPGDASAQPSGWWTLSGSNLYPNSTAYNVGIGTTQPASKFHLQWASNNPGAGQLFGDAAIFQNIGNVFLQLHGGDGFEKSINFAKPSNGADGAIKYGYYTYGASSLTFWTSGNQFQALIDGLGRVYGRRGLKAGGNWVFQNAMLDLDNSGVNFANIIYVKDSSGTVVFHLTNGGNLGLRVTDPTNILTVKQNSVTDPIADAWTIYSSRRWKTNIQTIESALDIVKQLRGVSFDWTANDKHDIGLIAEEVGQVVPEVVTYEANGVDAKSVDYNRLVAILIQAVKEQQAQIEKQQAMINALANKEKTDVTAPNAENVSAQERIAALEQEVATLKAEKDAADQRNAAMEARLAALEKAIGMRSASAPLEAGLPSGWLLSGGLLLVGLFLGLRSRSWKR